MSNAVWFNPYYRVPLVDIYPDKDISSMDGKTPQDVNVLTFQFYPDSSAHSETTWAGVMTQLEHEESPQYPVVFPAPDSLQKFRFVEMMIRGTSGRLHLDLGVISEDIIPNGTLDTEDNQDAGV